MDAYLVDGQNKGRRVLPSNPSVSHLPSGDEGSTFSVGDKHG